MALKKISKSAADKIYIDGLIDTLLNFTILSPSFDARHLEINVNYQSILNFLKENGQSPIDDLEKIIILEFGETEDKEDKEYKLAKILILYNIINSIPTFPFLKPYEKFKLKAIQENVKEILNNNFSEYKIEFDKGGLISEYKPVETSSIIENLENIPKNIADPIKELLDKMKSDDELIGLIAKVYSEIEKAKPDKLKNLKKIDLVIYKKAWEFTKMLPNNVNQAKGHKSDSSLSIKDIAHTFALNASLVQKLIKINDDNSGNKK